MRTIPVASLLILSFVIEAKSSATPDKKVDAKCFVELVGGGETVAFWNISSKKLSGLSKSIVGRKVVVANSKQKVAVYKAHECALLNDDFLGSRAKIVDAETAR